jgi:phosphinothricin acetyltransferase
VGEYTVYVARHAHGLGIGRAMLAALAESAPGFGYWKLVGMIMPENAAGLALARSAGFREVGTHRAHARREGRWRDVTIVELHLDGAGGAGGAPPARP